MTAIGSFLWHLREQAGHVLTITMPVTRHLDSSYLMAAGIDHEVHAVLDLLGKADKTACYALRRLQGQLVQHLQ